MEPEPVERTQPVTIVNAGEDLATEQPAPKPPPKLFSGKRFFVLRHVKNRNTLVQNIVKNGGEVMSSQRLAHIIVADHDHPDAPKRTVSHKYILDSLEKGEDLDVHGYLRPGEMLKERGERSRPRKGLITRTPTPEPEPELKSRVILGKGRTPFSVEEDRELAEFLIERDKSRGNVPFKEFTKLHPNSTHTWQSWKDRARLLERKGIMARLQKEIQRGWLRESVQSRDKNSSALYNLPKSSASLPNVGTAELKTSSMSSLANRLVSSPVGWPSDSLQEEVNGRFVFVSSPLMPATVERPTRKYTGHRVVMDSSDEDGFEHVQPKKSIRKPQESADLGPSKQSDIPATDATEAETIIQNSKPRAVDPLALLSSQLNPSPSQPPLAISAFVTPAYQRIVEITRTGQSSTVPNISEDESPSVMALRMRTTSSRKKRLVWTIREESRLEEAVMDWVTRGGDWRDEGCYKEHFKKVVTGGGRSKHSWEDMREHFKELVALGKVDMGEWGTPEEQQVEQEKEKEEEEEEEEEEDEEEREGIANPVLEQSISFNASQQLREEAGTEATETINISSDLASSDLSDDEFAMEIPAALKNMAPVASPTPKTRKDPASVDVQKVFTAKRTRFSEIPGPEASNLNSSMVERDDSVWRFPLGIDEILSEGERFKDATLTMESMNGVFDLLSRRVSANEVFIATLKQRVPPNEVDWLMVAEHLKLDWIKIEEADIKNMFKECWNREIAPIIRRMRDLELSWIEEKGATQESETQPPDEYSDVNMSGTQEIRENTPERIHWVPSQTHRPSIIPSTLDMIPQTTRTKPFAAPTTNDLPSPKRQAVEPETQDFNLDLSPEQQLHSEMETYSPLKGKGKDRAVEPIEEEPRDNQEDNRCPVYRKPSPEIGGSSAGLGGSSLINISDWIRKSRENLGDRPHVELEKMALASTEKQTAKETSAPPKPKVMGPPPKPVVKATPALQNGAHATPAAPKAPRRSLPNAFGANMARQAVSTTSQTLANVVSNRLVPAASQSPVPRKLSKFRQLASGPPTSSDVRQQSVPRSSVPLPLPVAPLRTLKPIIAMKRPNTASSAAPPTPGDPIAEFHRKWVERGYPSHIVRKALFCTTLNGGVLARRVLLDLKHGQGIPKDIPGVWTLEEDDILKLYDDPALLFDDGISEKEQVRRDKIKMRYRRLLEKHGEETVELRRDFLENHKTLNHPY